MTLSISHEKDIIVEEIACTFCNRKYSTKMIVLHLDLCRKNQNQAEAEPIDDDDDDDDDEEFWSGDHDGDSDQELLNEDFLNDCWDQNQTLLKSIPVSVKELPSFIDPKPNFPLYPEELKALDLLTPMQTKAIKYVVNQSRNFSTAAENKVLDRVLKFKYSVEDLQSLIIYIRDRAPIIIHVDLHRDLSLIVKDTHYRNQFETKRSHGTLNANSRTQWEDRLFNKIYHQAKGFDRVKYGVLNLSNDPNGVHKCNYYGDSYFKLKGIRLRTSFSDKDSSSSDSRLASCEHYCHVLENYNDKELRAVLEIATGKKPFVSSRSVPANSRYKEVQIHGPLDLSQHVECLVVNKRYKKGYDNVIRDLKKFEEKFKVPFFWMDEYANLAKETKAKETKD